MHDIRKLAKHDASIILEMQEKIYSGLEKKYTFQKSSREFINYCLDDGGFIVTAFCNANIIAYRMVYFPKGREFNLGKDIGLPANQLPYVAHFDTIGVLPEWRGKKLSSSLNLAALEELKAHGIRHILATTSPENPAGLGQMLRAGFRQRNLVEKFGGNLRLVNYRPFPNTHVEVSSKIATKPIPLRETDRLKKMFSNGFEGVGLAGKKSKHPSLILAPRQFERRAHEPLSLRK